MTLEQFLSGEPVTYSAFTDERRLTARWTASPIPHLTICNAESGRKIMSPIMDRGHARAFFAGLVDDPTAKLA